MWAGRCASTPSAIAATARARATQVEAIVLETGPLAVWHWHALRAAGLPVACVHARPAAAGLATQLNKTDRNDAHGLAQLARAGWYRAVAVKSLESHRIRTLLAARAKLVGIRTGLYNQIRGPVKTFGLVLKPGKGGAFEAHVRKAVQAEASLRPTVESVLAVWRTAGEQKRALERQPQASTRAQATCQRLMTAPGVGVLTAAAFVAAIDDPARFAHSADVGAYLGLTPRRYQSGEVERGGRISKCGERLVRSSLVEAAKVLLCRTKRWSPLRAWGLGVQQRLGRKKAAVAVARKLAVILHRMWQTETSFEWGEAPRVA
jgi:transposase